MLAFKHASEILKEQLYLLDLIDPTFNREELLKTIDRISFDLRNCEPALLFERHESYLQRMIDIAHEQANENIQIAIKLLGAAVCFNILYHRLRRVAQRKIWNWVGWIALIFVCFIKDKNKSNPKRSDESSYQSKSSSSPTLQQMTYKEKQIIEYLQKNEPDFLKNFRIIGYSDKQIAQYVIEQARG